MAAKRPADDSALDPGLLLKEPQLTRASSRRQRLSRASAGGRPPSIHVSPCPERTTTKESAEEARPATRKRRPRCNAAGGPEHGPPGRQGAPGPRLACNFREGRCLVCTTKLWPTFSPASSGSVHSLTIASRALLAWIEHIPGNPLFSAINRSRHSSWRTSPTMMRSGGRVQGPGQRPFYVPPASSTPTRDRLNTNRFRRTSDGDTRPPKSLARAGSVR